MEQLKIFSCLVGTIALLPLRMDGQDSFDRICVLPGDTMTTIGGSMHVSSAANGDLLMATWHYLENGPGPSTYIALVHRVATDGTLLWRRKLTVPSGYLMLDRLREYADGTITALCGVIGPPPSQGLYVHLDASGAVLSSRKYLSGTITTEVYDVAELDATRILLVARTYLSGVRPMYAIADHNGDLLSTWNLQFPGSSSKFERMTACTDGGYLLSGSGSRYVNPDTTFYSMVLARIDSAGAIVWAERLEEVVPSGLFSACGVHQLPGGGFRGFMKSRVAGTGHDDVVMFALTEEGQLSWKERITFFGGGGFPAAASVRSGDAEFCLAGGYGGLGRGAMVVDTNGTVLSAYAAAATELISVFDATATNDGMLASLVPDNDPNGDPGHVPRLIKDGFVPANCSPYPLTYQIDTVGLVVIDTWICDTLAVTVSDASSAFAIVSETPDVLDGCIGTWSEDRPAPDEVTIRPDPVQDMVTLAGVGIDQVIVIDPSGRTVLSRSFDHRSTVELDLSALAPGLYHLAIRQGDRWCTQRLIKA